MVRGSPGLVPPNVNQLLKFLLLKFSFKVVYIA